MNFIKRVLATVTGIFVFLFICIFLLFIIGFFVGKMGADEMKISKNSILELKLDFPVKDNDGKIIYKDLSFLNEENKRGLFQLVNAIDRKSTRLNSSHVAISYAVFCLKKKS